MPFVGAQCVGEIWRATGSGFDGQGPRIFDFEFETKLCGLAKKWDTILWKRGRHNRSFWGGFSSPILRATCSTTAALRSSFVEPGTPLVHRCLGGTSPCWRDALNSILWW